MKPTLLVLTALLLATSACARSPAANTEGATAQQSPPAAAPQASAASAASAASPVPAVPAAALPPVVVHKSATCGCCKLWVEHLQAAGFRVEVRDEDDQQLLAVKERIGVPYGKGSCHTAEVGGYFVEGHVPAEDIKRLLAERPDAKGLVLPGMPLGSPGMEVPDGTVQPYTVELVDRAGTTAAFAQH